MAQLYESILRSYLAHKFLGTKHTTGAPGYYESTGIMASEDSPITGQFRGILSSYVAHILLGLKAITSIPG